MKAECFILLCGCLILGLAGCSCKKSDRQQEILPVGAVDNTVGLNDTLGISLHPEYPVYSTRQKQIIFVLSNQSGMNISYGLDYRYTYEDEAGIWREISKRPVVFEVEYVLLHGGKQYIYADLYRNLPGRYRFFSMFGDTTEVILSWLSSVYGTLMWWVNKNSHYNRKVLME